MRYYTHIPDQPRGGPYSLEELAELYLRGALGPKTPLESEDGLERIRFQELWNRERGAAGPLEKVDAQSLVGAELGSARRAGEDLRALTPHLLVPWEELKSGRWLRHRRAMVIAAIGLLPLLIIAALGNSQNVREASWAMAFYFSALWAGFFYYAFPASGVNFPDALFCFLGSTLTCTLLLWLLYSFTPVVLLLPWIQSTSLLKVWTGFILAVGVPEELCKMAVLLILFRRHDAWPRRAMLFYGLMAGLGFGIYEGVRYQFNLNPFYAQTAEGYYLLNVLRLTSLPFLHAVWTGIAGHFLGFAFRYPERRRILLTAALLLPAVLHGTYNTFSRSFFGVLIAAFAVLALSIYMAREVDLDTELRRRTGGVGPMDAV